MADKFTFEEMGYILDLTESAGYPTFMRELRRVANSQVDDVMKHDVLTGGQEQLVQKKCRAEGALKLIQDFMRHLDILTKSARKLEAEDRLRGRTRNKK